MSTTVTRSSNTYIITIIPTNVIIYANIMLQIYGVIHLGELCVISSRCKSTLNTFRAIYFSVYNVYGLRHHIYNNVVSAVPT